MTKDAKTWSWLFIFEFFTINYLIKMSCRENISYLVPRDPSIKCWSDRVKLSSPYGKNLIQLGTDEFEETMGGNIKVYLRLKASASSNSPYRVLSSTTLLTEAPKKSVSYKNASNGVGKLAHKFTFTSILDQNTTQEKFFKKCAVKSLKKFLSGENFLLMAYGTTSAGKTYTMQGNVQHPGVIPRALDFVFSALKDSIIPACNYAPYQYNEIVRLSEEQLRKDLMHKNLILSLDLSKYQKYPDVTQLTFHTTSSSGYSDSYENVTFKEMQSNLVETESFEVDTSGLYKYAIWISMIEIYNEQVYDLLELPNEKGVRSKLTFRDDEDGNLFVKNLRYVHVSSGHEAFQIFQFGKNNLHLAPTALNNRSSRSHCIFTITLAKFLDSDVSSHTISRFSFCDLAGMERAKKTLNLKDRLVESKAINTSLSILVKCLTTFKENQNSKEKKMIPYRESKLTKLFRDAVLGKEQFSLIINVTTEPNLFDETLSVLKFSSIAQKIIPPTVFPKPKIPAAVKRSRFSKIVASSSHRNQTIINWDASTVVDPKTNSNSESTVEELQNLVETLREELAREKQRCEEIEAEIREELTDKFSEMFKEQNEHHRIRMKNNTERLKEMYEKKEERLVYYYEMLTKNKRPKLDEEVSFSEENKMKELEENAELLRTENGTLKEQLQELVAEKKRLMSECSELRFKLVDKERTLEDTKRAYEAKEAGADAHEKELRGQLDKAVAKIANFKSLLDEAASDYKELEENNRYLRNENEVLEQELLEHKEAVFDLKNENAELQKLLCQKRILIEKLEAANEDLEKQKGELETEKENSKEVKHDLRNVEVLREQLKKMEECLEQSNDECRELREDLEIGKLKIADLQSKLLSCEEESGRRGEMERRIEELKEEVERLKELESTVEELEKEKESLEERCKELELEVKSLQKEVKGLISLSKCQSEGSLELERLTKEKESYEKELMNLKKRNEELEEELKRQEENLNTVQRESKAALESLRAKLEAVEHQNSIMKDLKDEAERQAYEVPQLHEEIKRLEKEIENREKDTAPARRNRKAVLNNNEEKSKSKEENEDLRDNLFANEFESDEVKESAKERLEESLEEETDLFKKPEREGSQPRSDESNKVSPVANGINIKEEVEDTPERITKQIQNLSLQRTGQRSTRKRVDLLEETIHPSTIKNTTKGRRKRENGKKDKEKETVVKAIENEKENMQSKKRGKCYKKLFTDNDFDSAIDLRASPLEEISRQRPRK